MASLPPLPFLELGWKIESHIEKKKSGEPIKRRRGKKNGLDFDGGGGFESRLTFATTAFAIRSIPHEKKKKKAFTEWK